MKKKTFLDRYLSFFKDSGEIISLFNHQYTLYPALTPEFMREAYRLRQKVFCAEFGYFKTNERQEEQDDYDKFSTQVVLYYKPQNIFIGGARFIHGHQKDSEIILPFEALSNGGLDADVISRVKKSGEKYAEISRLSIDRSFRHVGTKRDGACGTPMRASCATIAMLLGIQAFAKLTETRYMFAFVEQRLINLLRKLSVPCTVIGEAVEHLGKRYPILMDRDEIEKIIPFLMRPLYQNLLKHIDHSFEEMSVDPLEHFGSQESASLPILAEGTSTQ